jgi:hypothetical protein
MRYPQGGVKSELQNNGWKRGGDISTDWINNFISIPLCQARLNLSGKAL